MMRNRSRRNDESLEQSSASGIVSVMNRIARPLLSDTVPPGLVRMRVIATGLLVLMAALFFVARAFEPAHPGLGYLRSFAEAAMVGGLADWFAVTALFRHPLGLPRSEEHTSELQSLMRISYAVFCLKKKKNNKN